MPLSRVLCLSYDQPISEERRQALKKAGFDVVATTVVEQAFAVARNQKCHALVIGHHFTDEQTNALIADARSRWHCPVIVITGVGAPSDARADVSVPILSGVMGLVRTVVQIVPRIEAA